MSIATVPCESNVTLSATGNIRHLCPFKNEVDHGTVTITWTVAGQTLELHALAAWLDEFRDARTSHEDLTSDIATAIAILPGVADVRVATTWDTAGLAVTCTSGASSDAVHG